MRAKTMTTNELAFVGELSKGDNGRSVKVLQEWLNFHKCGTSIDADFGVATELALLKFQTLNGLPTTGTLDKDTWNKLTLPMSKALAPLAFPPTTTLSQAVLEFAKQHLAQHPVELGGDNCGAWVRLYMNGHEGEAWKWCAGFVTFILKQACEALQQQLPINGGYGVDQLAQQAKQDNRFYSGDGMSWVNLGRCQIFLIRSKDNPNDDWIHTGFSFDGNGPLFSTIEGNTNDEGSSNGYEVAERARSITKGGIVKADFIKLD